MTVPGRDCGWELEAKLRFSFHVFSFRFLSPQGRYLSFQKGGLGCRWDPASFSKLLRGKLALELWQSPLIQAPSSKGGLPNCFFPQHTSTAQTWKRPEGINGLLINAGQQHQ